MTRSVGHDDFRYPCPRFNLASEGLQFPRKNLNISHELTNLFPRMAPCLRLWLMIWISILTCSQFDPNQSYSIVYKLIYPVYSVLPRPSPSSLFFMTIGCWMKKNDVAKMRQAGTAPATGTTIYCPTSLWCTVIYKLLVLCTANTLLRVNVRLVLRSDLCRIYCANYGCIWN